MAVINLTNLNAVTFKILPSPGPTKNSEVHAKYLENGANTIKTTGTLPTGTPASPAEARLLTSITADNFITWSDGLGGTIWWWLEVTAGEGETTSLVDVSGIISSPDPDNILGKTVTFVGTGYSPTAPGIRADGSEVTSGPANQQVKRLIVAIGSKSFPVTSTAEAQGVRDWIAQFPNWSTTLVVTAKGATASLTLKKGQPVLKAMRTGGKFIVTAANNGDLATYGLQTVTALGNPSWWKPAGTIRAGQSVDLGLIDEYSALFVRYAPASPITTQGLKPKLKAPPVAD